MLKVFPGRWLPTQCPFATEMIYREEIEVPLAKWLTWFFALFALGFAWALVYQLLIGPIGENPAPTWFWGLMMAIQLGVLVLLRNFRRLEVEMTKRHITVGFGAIRRTIPWDRVAEARRDERSLLSYGGAGWRLSWSRRRGGWIMAFVDPRSPRVVLELRGGRLRELVFSTRRPEEVRRLIEERLGGAC